MIGVYDSGLGGLTVLSHLRRRFPRADVLYFGDTEHLPYGTRSPDLIRRYADSAIRFFASEGVSALLVACGTVSTVALTPDRATPDFPLIGVAAPAAAALAASKKTRIAVLATAATVATGAYEHLLTKSAHGVSVLQIACPLFVSLVENGVTDPRDPALHMLVARCLAPCFSFRPDAILLGCTHFPVIGSVIGALFPSAELVDCGKAAVDALPDGLDAGGSGRTRYCVSDSPERFREAARHIAAIDGSAVIETVKTDRY